MPIKHHVTAKRYLARNKKYFDSLSKASKISLKLQGGVLNRKESKDFEKQKFFKNAIKLRKFDEVAKKSNIKIKSITCSIETSFKLPSIKEFEQKITKKTRAILICNPGNPTGAVYTLNELKQLGKIKNAESLKFIKDEYNVLNAELDKNIKIDGNLKNLFEGQ